MVRGDLCKSPGPAFPGPCCVCCFRRAPGRAFGWCRDDLVGSVIGQQTIDECSGVGILLDATLLEAIELFTGLTIQVFAVNDENAFVDCRVGLEQRGGLEAGERFSASCGMPHIAVAEVPLDALDNVLDGVNLIRPHHHQLLLAGNQDHVPADHLAEGALGEEGFGEGVDPLDLRVVEPGVLVDGKEPLVGVKSEVAGVVVGEVVGAVAVGNNEELHEAEQRAGVAVAGIVLVFDDLLDGPSWIDAQSLEFDLNGGDAVDEQDDIIPMVAVVGVDPKLADDFERVLTPVVDVDEREVERGAVIAGEAAPIAERVSGSENVGGDNLIKQALELSIGQADMIERIKFLAEVLLKGRPVTDIRTVRVLEDFKRLDQLIFEVRFICHKQYLRYVCIDKTR